VKGLLRLLRDRFYLNLAVLLAAGVLALYWIGRFTEHLQDVLTLLAMGGAAAWIGFVANILRSRRKEHLQLLIDGVLAHRLGSAAATAAVAALFGWCSTHGTIIFDSAKDSAGRRIVVRHGKDPTRERPSFDLAAGGKRKLQLWSGWAGREYVVDAEGLPLLAARVLPFRRTEVVLPSAALATNVVLIRPSTALSRTAAEKGTSYSIAVKLGGEELGSTTFTGQTVWVGCRASVDVPEALERSWRAEIAGEKGSSRLLEKWLAPGAIGEARALSGGQDIEIRIKKSDGTTYLRRAGTIVASRRAEDFPQVMEIGTDDTEDDESP
jgi:hypothetical protein